MEEHDKMHVHLSALISSARIKLGFSTLREFFREKKPGVEYQAWLHAESGRRIPSPKILVLIGKSLGIRREDLLIAYCKDKFVDVESHAALDILQTKGYFDVATLVQAKDHDRSIDYVFTAHQLKAMQEDIRIRLYMIYTYDKQQKTTIERLMNFFGESREEVVKVIENLKSLRLVETIGDEVKKIHFHTTIPITADICDMRKQFLLKCLDLSLDSSSYICNYHVTLSEGSYKKILAMFDFFEANLTQFEKEDLNDPHSTRYQIAIAGTTLHGAHRERTNLQSEPPAS